MEFLAGIIGNPFSTPTGQLIEKATDVSQVSEDWGLYMEICDLINSTEDGPRDSVKAIKKQLSNNAGKNNVVVLYTLTVLETCVKNCGRRFHFLIAQKDFLQELVKILTLKMSPPQIVVDRILGLLQVWADAFQGSEELKEVELVCEDLKEKGFEFPITDFQNAAPIHTPAKKACPSNSTSPLKQTQWPESIGTVAGQFEQPIEWQEPAVPAPNFAMDTVQMAKLRSELDVVQQNCKVMNEMLTEMIPNQESSEDWQLLQDLNQTCIEMQKRLVDLVGKVQIEEITCELLRVNDEINNVLLRYERYDRMRSGQSNQRVLNSVSQPGSLAPAPNSCIPAESEAIQTGTLVDLEEQNLLSSTNSKPYGNEVTKPADAAFNPFADMGRPQQKSQFKEVELGEVTGGLQKSLAISTNPYTNQEFVEDDDDELLTNHTPAAVKVSATSSEFDQFLATRAAAETQPLLDITCQHGSTNRNNDDEPLFSL